MRKLKKKVLKLITAYIYIQLAVILYPFLIDYIGCGQECQGIESSEKQEETRHHHSWLENIRYSLRHLNSLSLFSSP